MRAHDRGVSRQTAGVDVEYRAIREDEFDAFERVAMIAFGQEPFSPDMPEEFARLELDRTRAAFVGDEIVGAGRNYSFELTLPGGDRARPPA